MSQESELRLRALVSASLVEREATRYREALRIDTEAAPLFEKSTNHLLRGKFHNGFANALKNLGLAHVPVIFLTAGKKRELWDIAQEVEHAGFFEKPYDPKQLLASVHRALAQNRASTPRPDSNL